MQIKSVTYKKKKEKQVKHFLKKKNCIKKKKENSVHQLHSKLKKALKIKTQINPHM